MAWIDKATYWAGGNEDFGPAPTVKRLSYCHLSYPHGVKMKICDGVYDDDVFTPLHDGEVQWHINHGAVVEKNAAK